MGLTLTVHASRAQFLVTLAQRLLFCTWRAYAHTLLMCCVGPRACSCTSSEDHVCTTTQAARRQQCLDRNCALQCALAHSGPCRNTRAGDASNQGIAVEMPTACHLPSELRKKRQIALARGQGMTTRTFLLCPRTWPDPDMALASVPHHRCPQCEYEFLPRGHMECMICTPTCVNMWHTLVKLMWA